MWYISCEFAFFDSENIRDMYSMTPNLLNFFRVSGYEKKQNFTMISSLLNYLKNNAPKKGFCKQLLTNSNKSLNETRMCLQGPNSWT